MQTRNYLPKKLYPKSSIDGTEYSQIVYERKEKVHLFDKLRESGCSESLALEAIKIPRSTIYRWKRLYKLRRLLGLEQQSRAPNKVRKPEWSLSLEGRVLQLRRQNPTYGKSKIAIILKRDWNTTTSISTVGRILAQLIKRDAVKPASFYSAKRRIRSRVFNNHAQRWKRDMKAKCPGEYIQIDHMSVSLDSAFSVKHFQAICPVTKIVVEEAYRAATSNIASNFLEIVRKQMPFPIQSIQVDGGSEFMGEFEQACKNYNIPLYVLPPKSPECNGVVERANGSAKFEFYYLYDGPSNLFGLRQELIRYVKKYNTFRPHQALQYLTPWQYYKQLNQGGLQSHMY